MKAIKKLLWWLFLPIVVLCGCYLGLWAIAGDSPREWRQEATAGHMNYDVGAIPEDIYFQANKRHFEINKQVLVFEGDNKYCVVNQDTNTCPPTNHALSAVACDPAAEWYTVVYLNGTYVVETDRYTCVIDERFGIIERGVVNGQN